VGTPAEEEAPQKAGTSPAETAGTPAEKETPEEAGTPPAETAGTLERTRTTAAETAGTPQVRRKVRPKMRLMTRLENSRKST
jgi:hypothetical protein